MKAARYRQTLPTSLPSPPFPFLSYSSPHPPNNAAQVPLILDGVVSATEGTAILHLAPSCGVKDFAVGSQHEIQLETSFLTEDGKFSENIIPSYLAGKSLEEGEQLVLGQL